MDVTLLFMFLFLFFILLQQGESKEHSRNQVTTFDVAIYLLLSGELVLVTQKTSGAELKTLKQKAVLYSGVPGVQ